MSDDDDALSPGSSKAFRLRGADGARAGEEDDPRLSLPLDWVVSDTPPHDTGAWIVEHWDELTPGDLPVQAARAVLAGADASAVLTLTAERRAFTTGWADLVDAMPTRLSSTPGQVALTLRRLGLTCNEFPTLQSLADERGVTRERIRQLLMKREALLGAIVPSDRAALSVSAHFALAPRLPWSLGQITAFAGGAARARRVELVLEALKYPVLEIDEHRFWCQRLSQVRALRALTSWEVRIQIPHRPWQMLVQEVRESLPGVESVLDLEETLRLVSRELAIPIAGVVGPSSSDAAIATRAFVRKIVTFLRARGCPIDAEQLAGVVELARWPFGGTKTLRIEPSFLLSLADRYPHLLARDGHSKLRIAEGPQEPDPGTTLGTVYRIVRDYGKPIETSELNHLAGRVGISANHVGVMVHGPRGPCLFPLARGVVGLVGRDDRGVLESRATRRRDPLLSASTLLLPDGWAVQVSGAGRGASDKWVLPQVLVEQLGIRLGSVVRLTDSDARLQTVLHLEPKLHSCPGHGLSTLLPEAEIGADDLAFLVLRPPHYHLLLRRASELADDASAPERVCWSCGLAPSVARQNDAWYRIGRTIGGGSDRASVRARLRARGQDDLAALLDAPDVAVELTRGWPPQWHYTAPLVSETKTYAVFGDDLVRVAVGVAAGRRVCRADEVLSDGGVLWQEIDRNVFAGKIPADSPGEDWHRWARAEHAARRAALAGRAWAIGVSADGLTIGDARYDELLEALEAIGDVSDADIRASVEPSNRPYPRGGLAFSLAVRKAIRNGLVNLRGDVARGFTAKYQDGVIDGGPTLLDAFDRRGI
jgi:hypothetical protein